ncbi:MAG: hypothetical protein KC420_09955, partial [Myxococcales bacterium]|nr:hypothetical protein [Myxococcales bacterium]
TDAESATATATATGGETTGASTSGDETTGGVMGTGPEHCGTITSDEVWTAALSPHVVTCDVHIEGGTVTVEPGVEVRVENDFGIFVAEDGGTANLRVLGSADAPVRFVSASGVDAGLWRGIVISSAAGEVELHHTTIDSAGGFNADGNLWIEDSEVLLDHVTLTNFEGFGLGLRDGASLTPESAGLQIHGGAGWPVIVDPGFAHTLPLAESDYKDNESDGIYIEPSNLELYTVREHVVWRELGVPYYVFRPLKLAGGATKTGILELEAGVELRFDDGAPLEMAYSEGAAGLITRGTAERPVILSSMNSKDRGAWPGVLAYDNTDDESFELVHTIIEWGGGSNSDACLVLVDTSVRVDHLTLRGCEDAGFDLSKRAFFRDGSGDLVVTDSARPGEIETPVVHTVPREGVSLTGNDVDELWVRSYDPVDKAVSWADLGVPYHATTDVNVEGSGQTPAVLTLEPGVVLGFEDAMRLWLSRYGGASGLMAVGTADAPVILTGAQANDPGAWGGVVIYDEADDAKTRFEHAEIRWGAGFNTDGNVELWDASPTFSDVVIAGSDCWGIRLYGASAPQLQNVTFDGNACGDVGP